MRAAAEDERLGEDTKAMIRGAGGEVLFVDG